MNEAEMLAAARQVLRAHLETLVGPGPIARFEEALTHASFANENGAPNNQRLEFLGDAVLGLCVSEMLATAHVHADEGKLTRMRSALVNAGSLAAWARSVDLGACVGLGRGAKLGTEREQKNVLADAAEALVAAIYDAHGMVGARALVREIVGDRIGQDDALSVLDPKSELQERVQAGGSSAPTYRAVGVRGPPHEQVFEVEVVVDNRAVARGEGRSKRLAERSAAISAIAEMAEDDAAAQPADAPPLPQEADTPTRPQPTEQPDEDDEKDEEDG
jgi:ribonuclease-3